MRKSFLVVAVGVISTLGGYFLVPAEAQEKFPNKAITFIHWSAPGGAEWDIRAFQPEAEKALGQPIVIVHKTGAGGTIGLTAGATARPDGYTLTYLSPSIVITPYTMPSKNDYRDFDPVVLTVEMPAVIAVRVDAPWKTFKEFIEYARSNPGKARLSNSGYGAIYHIGAVGLEAAAGAKFTHVPFKGSGPAVTAVPGGHVDGVVASWPTVSQLVAGGKLRVLATGSEKRYYASPDVPTFRESGVDFEFNTWYGYGVPKGTPRERVRILHDAIKRGLDSPQYKATVKELGAGTHYMGPEDFGKFLENQDRVWKKIIEYGGFKPSN